MSPTNDVTLSFKLPHSLKQLLKQLAKEQKVTTSQLVLSLLKDTTNYTTYTPTTKLLEHKHELH